MKIVISGAGDVGTHLVEKLSSEDHDITVIEPNQKRIDYLLNHFDVAVLDGDCMDYNSLEEAGVCDADLYIAVTHTQELNLLSGIYAKKLGVKKVISRVDYFRSRSDRKVQDLYEMGVDEIISPNTLVSKEIISLITQRGFSDIVKFEHGKLFLVGFPLKKGDDFVGKRIGGFLYDFKMKGFRILSLQRGDDTIPAKENVIFKAGDSAYFVCTQEGAGYLAEMSHINFKPIERIVIVGGGLIGIDTARRLQNKYKVTLIESDKEKCQKLASELSNALIVHGDSKDPTLLEDVRISETDALIAVTDDVENNIITCLYAKEIGDVNTIALVKDSHYIHATQNIGIDTLVNKKIIAADFISKHIRQGKIVFVASIPGVDMEVVDFEISKTSKIIGKKIVDLELFSKNDPIILGGVVRKGKIANTDENFVFQLGDRVVVACFGNCSKISDSCF